MAAGKVDVHHHILPPQFVQVWENSAAIPKGLKLPPWSADLSIAFMDRNGIDFTILSLSAPALSIVKDKQQALSLCREINQYVSSVRDQNSSRFGFFATVPIIDDDIASALDEIAFCFDSLQADGVTLLTSYAGRYLGHPDFRALWEDLNRREAVVFVHPTLETGAGALTDPYLPRPIIDFPHETTRTAVHLIMAHVLRDFAKCRIVLSHGGGTLPFVATRVANQAADVKLIDMTADEFMRDAQSFYFDLALSAFSQPVELLLKFAQPDHVLYGSDFPFARESTSGPQAAFIDSESLDGESQASIKRGAASRLFPRLAK